MAVRMYMRLPFLCFSMVSKAMRWPEYRASNPFGFLKIFCRFTLTTLPVPVIFAVAMFGAGSPRAEQNSASRGRSFVLPRFLRSRLNRLISSRIRTSQERPLLFLGVRFLGFNDSSFPRPFRRLLCQRNNVLRFTRNASSTASVPCFSQNASMRTRLFGNHIPKP